MKNSQINWGEIRKDFEEDMSLKLASLPGHKEVTDELRPFRSIISHELPETTVKEVYDKLINILLDGIKVNLQEIKDEYLNPELLKENKRLVENSEKFDELKKLAKKWVEKSLPEKNLQDEWNDHKTWLPRRYTIYENPDVLFQKIAADTLARYYLITSNVKILS